MVCHRNDQCCLARIPQKALVLSGGRAHPGRASPSWRLRVLARTRPLRRWMCCSALGVVGVCLCCESVGHLWRVGVHTCAHGHHHQHHTSHTPHIYSNLDKTLTSHHPDQGDIAPYTSRQPTSKTEQGMIARAPSLSPICPTRLSLPPAPSAYGFARVWPHPPAG